MRSLLKTALGAAALVGATTLVAPVAGASGWRHDGHGPGPAPAIFVQTDNTSGNQVVAYDRTSGGTLTPAGAYATGGIGGVLNGSAVDHLASQGALNLADNGRLLLAVNAGSNSISVFRVDGDTLSLRQTIGSGGTFPSSITSFDDTVYVLNALDGGSLQGFRIFGDQLFPIAGSSRELGLTTPSDITQFTHTPGQVAFTPDGNQLVVTTKATTSAVDVFGVWPDGRLSFTPTVNVEANAVPFAVTFDQGGRLIVADAGTNAVSSYHLRHDGTLVSLDTVLTGQKATCWIAQAQGVLFASNAGSADVSTLTQSGHGQLTLTAETDTDPGTVDAVSTPDGRFLYVEAGLNGNVDEFSVASSGALSPLGSVTVPAAAGAEGIVAT
jgi:6-phosphogluconolactonase (cycloisomerase 2 family)